ncbi:MAG TPA: GlsB/YeaQ/YmgE family stress response membrane protein [Gemmatimonadaceae bacterium]
MIIQWIVLGLVAGALAKFLVPGRDPSGCIITVLLGVLGAVLGGWIGSLFGWGRITSPRLDARSIAIATFGAIVLLVLGRMVARRR